MKRITEEKHVLMTRSPLHSYNTANIQSKDPAFITVVALANTSTQQPVVSFGLGFIRKRKWIQIPLQTPRSKQIGISSFHTAPGLRGMEREVGKGEMNKEKGLKGEVKSRHS